MSQHRSVNEPWGEINDPLENPKQYFSIRSTDYVKSPEITERLYDKIVGSLSNLPKVYIYVAVAFVLMVATMAPSNASGVRLAKQVESCSDYIVQPGDSFYGIAKKFKVTGSYLLEINPQVEDPDLIYAGEGLCTEGPLQLNVNPKRIIWGEDSLFVTGKQRNLFDTTYPQSNWNNGQAQPGAIALANVLNDYYPNYGDSVHELYGVGLYAARPPRGGSGWSTHSTGRAIDLFLPPESCYGEDNLNAYLMFGNLVGATEKLGISRILMCDLSWNSRDGWTKASEALIHMHDGTTAPAHIHIELSHDAAANLSSAWATRVVAGFD